MSRTKTGSCLCAAVRYTIRAEPAMQVICHCSHCQRQSGSAFSTIIGVPECALEVIGEVRTYNDRGDNGSEVLRQFCPRCGSPLFSRVAATPGMVYIKSGTLDDPRMFHPQAHIWTKSALEWVSIDSAPAFETKPGG